jgi:hypothetical protein
MQQRLTLLDTIANQACSKQSNKELLSFGDDTKRADEQQMNVFDEVCCMMYYGAAAQASVYMCIRTYIVFTATSLFALLLYVALEP